MSTTTGQARRWPRTPDIVPAVVLLLFGLPGTVGAGRFGPGGFGPGDYPMPIHRDVDVLALVLVAGAAVALLWRRRYPVAVLGIVSVIVAGYLVLDYPYGPIIGAYVVAVYSVARHRPVRRSIPAVAVSLVLLMAHLLTGAETLLGVGPGLAWAVVPFAIGAAVRNAAETADRARADAVRKGVDTERLRVAQEVHDVVGHGLAAIKMQADVALHLQDRQPEQATRALQAISETSGEALQDLRATLAAVQGAEAPREPGPGLDRLDDLRARMEASGLSVVVQRPAAPLASAAPVEVAAYRVVQESLTNVLKHSAERTAQVTIEHRDGHLLVRVTNPLPPDAPPEFTPGLGIPGMRERVTALGGAFRAGPTHGLFEVEAVIPVGDPSAGLRPTSAGLTEPAPPGGPE